jgi:hypothetical protein
MLQYGRMEALADFGKDVAIQDCLTHAGRAAAPFLALLMPAPRPL